MKQSKIKFKKSKKVRQKDKKGNSSKAVTEEQEGIGSIDANILEKLLQFDLDITYGPCVGISRMVRWNRANDFQKKPDKNIHKILSSYPPDNDQIQQCIWYHEL